jgi:hypothetical protein
MNPEQDNVCKAHSGICQQVETLGENVKALWRKWDWLMAAIVANLAGIVILLLKTKW